MCVQRARGMRSAGHVMRLRATVGFVSGQVWAAAIGSVPFDTRGRVKGLRRRVGVGACLWAAAVCERSLLEGIPACIVVVLFVWFAVDVCVYECMFVHFLFFMFGYLSDNVRFLLYVHIFVLNAYCTF